MCRVVTVLLLLVCATVVFGADAKFRPVPDGVRREYIVVLSDLPSAKVASVSDELARKHGALVRTTWRSALKGFWAEMPEEAARAMSADPRVRYVQQNVRMQMSGLDDGEQDTTDLSPFDRDNETHGAPYPETLTPKPLWHLARLNNRRNDARYYTYDTSGNGVRIYVVDSGVIRFHQEFIASGTSTASDDDRRDPDLHSRVEEIQGSNVAPRPPEPPLVDDGDGYPSSAPFIPPADNATPTNNVPCSPPSTLMRLDILNTARTQVGEAPYNPTIWFPGRIDLSHGTAVASVAAGRNVGVAKEATIVPVKVIGCDDEERGTEAAFISAFEWILQDKECVDGPGGTQCVRPPAVVTMSTYRPVTRCVEEGGPCHSSSDLFSLPLLFAAEEAIRNVIADGVPVVVSANNNSRDACEESPARLSWSGGLGALHSSGGGVITVGGLAKETDNRWVDVTRVNNPGSNWGPCVDLFAPAETIAVAAGSGWADYRAADVSGTSFSAPMVAGLIARMFTDDKQLWTAATSPNLAIRAQVPATIWERLRVSATPFEADLEHDKGIPVANAHDDVIFRATKKRIAYLGAFALSEQPASVVLTDTRQDLSVCAANADVLPTPSIPCPGDLMPTTYQWYTGESGTTEVQGQSTMVANASGRTLCVQSRGQGCVAPAQNTKYWVRVTRNGRSADSAAATVVVNVPIIVKQPESTWTKDGSATLEVTTLPATGVSFRWYEATGLTAKTVAPGTSTQRTYSVTGATSTSGYFVEATFQGATVSSEVAVVRSCPPIEFAAEAFRFSPEEARSARMPSFRVTVNVTGAEKYQWYAGVAGDTTQPLTATSATVTLTGGVHSNVWVRALTTCGYLDSPTLNLPACTKIVLTESSRLFRRVPANAVTNFGVHVQTFGTGPLRYEWYRVEEAGGNTTLFRVTEWTGPLVTLSTNTLPEGATRNYSVLVSDGSCSVFSKEFRVLRTAEATCPPAVVANPEVFQPQMLFAGSTLAVPLRPGTVAFEWWRSSDVGAPYRSAQACNGCTAAELTVSESGSFFPRVIACELPSGAVVEDTSPILVEVAPCAQDGFVLRASPAAVASGAPFQLQAPAATVAGATYRWYEGLYGAATLRATTTVARYDHPGVSALTTFWVEIDPGANPDGCITRALKSAYLIVDPCSKPKRRSVQSFTYSGPETESSTDAGFPVELEVVEPESDVTYVWHSDDPATPNPGTGVKITAWPTRTTTYWAIGTRTCAGGVTVSEETERQTIQFTCTPPLVLDGPYDASAKFQNGVAAASTSVEPTGLKYQWYGENGAIPNATSSTYTWRPAEPSAAPYTLQQSVYVVVTDRCGSVTSRTAVLTASRCEPPTVTLTWGSGSVYRGGQAKQVGVNVEPAGNYTYEWYRGDGTLLKTTTTDTTYLTTYSLDAYYVRVKNDCGAVAYSKKIYLEVYGECAMPPLKVTQNTATIDPAQNEKVTFTATCDFRDVRFEWYAGQSGDTRNPIAPPAETPHQLTVGYPVGTYWVRALRSCGAPVDSSTLTYQTGSCKPNFVTQHPQSVDVAYNGTASLTAAAADAERKSFTWYEEKNLIDALSTGSTYTRSNITTSGRYLVKVRDTLCAGTYGAWSYPAAIRVASCPGITPPAWESERAVQKNSVTTLVATAAGATGYQWYEGEVGDDRSPIPAGTGDRFITQPVTADAKYWVRIQGNGCIVDSPTFNVRMCELTVSAPMFTNADLEPGQWARFFIEARGTGLQYQWYEGEPGVTTHPVGQHVDKLEVQPMRTTRYWVRVTNSCGSTAYDSPVFIASLCPRISGAPVAGRTKVMPGTTTTLSLDAQGDELQYKWYAGQPGDETTLVGTGSTITTPPMTQNTTFWCKVTSGQCPRVSDAVTVNICDEPTIQWSTGDKSISKGQVVTLAVTTTWATEEPMITYYKGPKGNLAASQVVNQTTSTSFMLQVDETSMYWARAVVGGHCYADTDQITVNVCIPTITTQPAGGQITLGQSKTLTVGTDITPTAYEWWQGSGSPQVWSAVPDSSGASITVSPTVDTWYVARVRGCGTTFVNAAGAQVTVCTPPQIASRTPDHWVSQNTTLDIRVEATGSALTYQWYRGNVGDISAPVGTNQSWLRITPSATTTYWARVTNSCGTVHSQAITISVCAPPAVTVAPASPTIYSGSTVTFTATASVATGTPLSYQWYSGTPSAPVLINGATGTAYTTPALTTGASYFVRVTSGTCITDSAVATVAICSYAQEVAATSDKNTYAGQTTRLDLVISPVPSQYRWYKGVAGDTSTPLTGWVAPRYLDVNPTITTPYWAEFQGPDCSSKTRTITVNVCVPVITQQPASGWVTANGQKTLTVAADLPGVTYQWFSGTSGGGTAITGATAASYTTPALTAAASYWVRVTGSCGVPTNSNTATITICSPPAINGQPGSTWIVRGSSTRLFVTATGNDLTYQWYQGTSGSGTAISGATASFLDVSPQTTTSYWVKVSGLCGSANSTTGTVSVCATPVISTQPQSQVIYSGGTATLSVTASQPTGAPLQYQWHDASTGAAISGATGATYTTPALTASTSYFVRIGSGGATCSIDSSVAAVTICPYPEVSTPISDRNIASGQTTRLDLVVSPVPTSYRFYRGVSGDRANPLTPWNSGRYHDVNPTLTTQYWAEYQNGTCTARTSTITVNVCVPTITQQPASGWVTPNGQKTLTVAADLPGVSYQWFTGTSGSGTAIAGATAASYTTPALTTAASYWVRVTGSCGVPTNSNTATISICSAPAINGQPGSSSIVRGSSTRLFVTATGNDLTYQWYQGTSGSGTAISGATASFLDVAPQTTTSYWVKVSGLCGSANSSTGTVSVCATPVINSQPQSAVIYSGGSATLSVAASQPTGSPLQYQWYNATAGMAIAGATGASYTTPALTADTSYFVRVSSGDMVCWIDSSVAAVTICPYPEVGYVIADRNTTPGQSTRLDLVVSPVPTLYRFYRGASGDRSNLLADWNTGRYYDVAPTVTTQYWAEYQNGSCTARTTTITVNVCVPTITQQPASTYVSPNTGTTLTVATNLPGATYQWYSGTTGGGTPIAGATSASYATGPLNANASYWVRVSGSCGVVADSTTATVTICTPPSIVYQPYHSGTGIAGRQAGLEVTANGSNLTYQWFKGEPGNTTAPVAGQTTRSMTITAWSTEKYWVRITGTCGTLDSNWAYISVRPSIYEQPGDTTVSYGQPATFSVGASGGYLRYEWYNGAGQIVGTGPTYTSPPITGDDMYRVLVYSGMMSEWSREAYVTVQ